MVDLGTSVSAEQAHVASNANPSSKPNFRTINQGNAQKVQNMDSIYLAKLLEAISAADRLREARSSPRLAVVLILARATPQNPICGLVGDHLSALLGPGASHFVLNKSTRFICCL